MTVALIAELAIVSVVSETPPAAASALVAQLAIISVDREYEIPIIYIPFSAGAFFQTMPYYIGM